MNKDHILHDEEGYDKNSIIVTMNKCLTDVSLDKYGTCDISVKHLTYDQFDALTRNILKDVNGLDVIYDCYYNKIDVSFIIC